MGSPRSGRPGGQSPHDAGAFSETSLLERLPVESIGQLRNQAELILLKADEWLFHEGDDADCAYVLRSGRVQVINDGRIMRSARRGGVIGELALLTGGTRTAGPQPSTIGGEGDGLTMPELLRDRDRSFTDGSVPYSLSAIRLDDSADGLPVAP
ncbi:MAG: cyclic nucleotide-binding domain-containing protein [Solirubrobacteraceae bacterium]